MLVDAWLPRAAGLAPQAIAVNNLSYGQLLIDAQCAARQLSALGVVAGDRVALVLPADNDFVVIFHAVLLLGAVAVPIDPRTPAGQREERAKGARVVVEGPLDGHQDPAARLSATHDLAAVAVVLFTSGSSGSATAVELTYGNFWWSAAGSAVALGLDRRERWLCCLPVSHVGGLSIILRSVIYGTEAIVHHGFELDRVVEQLRSSDGPTLISLVPTTLQRLLDAGLEAPPALRYALLGGGPISAGLLARADAAAVPVASSYGMTEACSQIATRGAPLFCTDIAFSEVDEMLVSGPTIAPQLAPVLRTGDIGRRAVDGSVEVVGRRTETIISGGENVSPEVVENVIARHPAVADVAVVARPDEEWGEAVTALVVLKADHDVDSDELLEFASAELSPHERPKRIEFRGSLGRGETGKLKRREL